MLHTMNVSVTTEYYYGMVLIIIIIIARRYVLGCQHSFILLFRFNFKGMALCFQYLVGQMHSRHAIFADQADF